MSSIQCTALRHLFTRYSRDPALQPLQDRVEAPPWERSGKEEVGELLEIYQRAIPLIERQMWSSDPDQELVGRYQELFREMESLLSIRGEDERHHFIVVVPVADRPRQLRSCLNSLLDLCRSYHYGGISNGRFGKVAVIVADDSKEELNRGKNREIASEINAQGVDAIYFGLDDQRRELASLSEREREGLSRVLGDRENQPLYHKGPSIMRNIAYLKLHQLANGVKNPLFYFMDSDQEFRVEVNREHGGEELASINYFYELDRLFTQSDVEVVTGKVVGDPPVSPAVMAGNFLDDVIAFLRQAAEMDQDGACQYHHAESDRADEAAYHDMADLFGFAPAEETYRYRCPLRGSHDNLACFEDFAARLNRFFYGEHPTRKSYYGYEGALESVTSARTIYTGNYVFEPQALRYYIPFAPLRLRMAGPVLGRIIRAEIKERFISANLPMLHKRTVQESGRSEFRPGVVDQSQVMDLSGEFERQYFGDVMLFTMERLADMGYPEVEFPRERIEAMVKAQEGDISKRYATKRREIQGKLELLKSIAADRDHWWNRPGAVEEAKANIAFFVSNIGRNFGDGAAGYELTGPGRNREQRLSDIVDAVVAYPEERRTWERALSDRGFSA